MKKIPISVIIITKNEEKRLIPCLKSISFADDIVILDSGSEDRTIEIAKNFGCRVFVEKWKGYGPQKQSALEKTKYKWVLSLDADERIPQETAETIKNIIKQPNASAYSFCRKNFFHGKWIKRCGWWPDRIIRLFDKSTGKFEGLVHERWVTYGKTINLQAYIEHYSFDNYSSMLKKLDVYSELAAIELFKKGVKPSIITPFSHSIWSFLKIYLLKQGFLEGLDGFIISFLNAAGHFFKYAKLIELYRYSDKIEYKH